MKRSLAVLLASAVLATGAVAHADHANRRGAHWGKRTVRLVDSVTVDWDTALANASATWNGGIKKIKTRVDPASDDPSVRQDCPFAKRAVRICNFLYGNTGIWQNTLGLAEYSFLLPSKHITRARIRLNDSVATPPYFEATAVHEIGHTLGLGHRPQSDALTSCMTPQISPAQISPDHHDFRSVNRLHRHLPHGAGKHSTAEDEGRVVHVRWRLTR